MSDLTQEKDLPPAQAELVNAERAFAKLAVERGVRESFIAYFADDGIAFAPHPHKVKERFSNSPAPATRPPITLNWAPAHGDIAQAGDLGWNTGPTLIEDTSAEKKPARHGMFFSVWKKQSDGSWRVVLDLGADTPAAVAPLNEPFKTSYQASSKRPATSVNVEEEIAGLLKVEREFLAAAKASSLGQAYQNHLSDDARVHRPGVMPVVGKDALSDWLAKQTAALSGEPVKADVSRSGDLGYAYGSYELGGAQPQRGYFARVWKRDDKGQWRVVMDTVSSLPPGTPHLAAQSREGLASKAQEYYLAQQWAEAAAAYQELIKQNPNSPVAWHRLGTSQIYLRQLPEAIKSLEQAIKVGGGAALDFYNLACAFALSGVKEKALDNLEKAVNAGFTDKQQYETDSDLNSLRETERFKELLKRLR
ncbi:MAG: TPR end-of-group domain-containing protein [Blastocatellia bacterium]